MRWALVHNDVIQLITEQVDMPAIAGEWVNVTSLLVGPGHLRSGGDWIAPGIVTPRRLTKLQFVGRLTQTEFLGLLAAAKTDVSVEAFVRMMDWATPEPDGTSIDLDDPRTVAGVQAILSPERAAQILA